MKPAGNAWLWLLVGLTTSGPAFAESVAQFAPVEEVSTPAQPAEVVRPVTRAPIEGSATADVRPATVQTPLSADPAVAVPAPASPKPATSAHPRHAEPTTVPPTLGPGGPSAGQRMAGPQTERQLQLTHTTATPDGPRDSGRTDDHDGDDDHYVSLSFSVVRAIASLYEVTGEVALGRHFGLALLGGVGSLETKHPEYDQTVELTGKEVGAQARIYVLGGFDHGLMLGGEALRIWADVSPTQVTDSSIVTINGRSYGGTAMLSGEGTLTALAAFIGYKVIAPFGLTLDAKLGWQTLTLAGTGRISGEAPINGRNVPVSESGAIRENQGVPLFNLNLGWSI